MKLEDLEEGAWDSFKQGFSSKLGTTRSFTAKKETPLSRIDPRVLKLVLKDILNGKPLTQQQKDYLQTIYKQL
jgi:hypothetical protein